MTNLYKLWYEEAMAESNKAGYVGMSPTDTINALSTERDAALADAKRLREALGWALAFIQMKGFGSGKHFGKARAALAATGETT